MCVSVCLSGYAFRPLTTYGDETRHGGRGRGPIISEGHQRSKVRLKFQVARIELKFREGDAGPRASAKCIGLSRRMSSEVK